MEEAKRNPFKFFTLAQVGELLGFGANTMTALVKAGAPIVARKCNPQLLVQWIGANADRIGKVRLS